MYFEPATAQDWTDISTLSNNLNALAENISNYYMEVTANGNTIPYEVDIQYGSIGVAPLSNTNDFSRASTVATKEGVAFKPALTIQGKKFTEFTRDNSTTPPTYKATVDGVTVKVYYADFPPDAYVSDDYRAIGTTINLLVFVPSDLRNLISDDFYNNILKIDSTKEFYLFRVYFKTSNRCEIQIAYQFEPNKTAYCFVNCSYELKNKRLYIKDKTTTTYNNTAWNEAQNAAIKAKASEAADKFLEVASEGFYVNKTDRKYGPYIIYSIQSRSNRSYSAAGATAKI